MGFFTEFGEGFGTGIGFITGGSVYLAGKLVDSKFLQDVGTGALNVSKNTGKMFGSLADSTVKCVSGIANSDNSKVNQGLKEIKDTTVNTAKGMGRGILKTAENGIETVGAIIDGDTEKAVKVGKEIVKMAAVGALSLGVCDVIDGVVDTIDIDDDGYELVENPNMHHVSPHYRTLPNGREIWVDGDGNTSVDTFDGWVQHNPDYRV